MTVNHYICIVHGVKLAIRVNDELDFWCHTNTV